MENAKEKKYNNLKWIIASVLVPIVIAGIGYWGAKHKDVKSPGELEILDIQVQQTQINVTNKAVKNPKENKCIIDFRIMNKGETNLLVNKIKFEVLDVVTLSIKGHLAFSMVYDIDISELDSIGDFANVSVSQEIVGGEIDRFGITLIAQDMPPGFERGWQLIPTLYTNYGEVVGKTIEVWFPYEKQSDDPKYFSKAKQWEKEEKEAMKKYMKDVE